MHGKSKGRQAEPSFLNIALSPHLGLQMWHRWSLHTEERLRNPFWCHTNPRLVTKVLMSSVSPQWREGKKRGVCVGRQVLTHWWDTHSPDSFWRNRSQLVFLCQWVLHVHSHRTVLPQRNTIQWPPGKQRGPLRDILHSTLTSLGEKKGKQSGMYNRQLMPLRPLCQTSQALCSPAGIEHHPTIQKQENLDLQASAMWD